MAWPRESFWSFRCDPSIYFGKFGRLPSLPDLDAFAGRRGTALFLCYHGCLGHKPWVTWKQAEGKCSASAPALTRSKGTAHGSS